MMKWVTSFDLPLLDLLDANFGSDEHVGVWHGLNDIDTEGTYKFSGSGADVAWFKWDSSKQELSTHLSCTYSDLF